MQAGNFVDEKFSSRISPVLKWAQVGTEAFDLHSNKQM
jgi:hypothetical protein